MVWSYGVWFISLFATLWVQFHNFASSVMCLSYMSFTWRSRTLATSFIVIQSATAAWLTVLQLQFAWLHDGYETIQLIQTPTDVFKRSNIFISRMNFLAVWLKVKLATILFIFFFKFSIRDDESLIAIVGIAVVAQLIAPVREPQRSLTFDGCDARHACVRTIWRLASVKYAGKNCVAMTIESFNRIYSTRRKTFFPSRCLWQHNERIENFSHVYWWIISSLVYMSFDEAYGEHLCVCAAFCSFLLLELLCWAKCSQIFQLQKGTETAGALFWRMAV